MIYLFFLINLFYLPLSISAAPLTAKEMINRNQMIEKSKVALQNYQKSEKKFLHNDQNSERKNFSNEEEKILSAIESSNSFDPDTYYYRLEKLHETFDNLVKDKDISFFKDRYGIWDTKYLLELFLDDELKENMLFFFHHRDSGIEQFLSDIKNRISEDKFWKKSLNEFDDKLSALNKLENRKNFFYFSSKSNFDLSIHPSIMLQMKKKIPILNLGTASTRGMYYYFGNKLSEKLKGKIDIRVISTQGSIDNFLRGIKGEVDGYIAQSDSFRVFLKDHPDEHLFTPIKRIYEEYLHMITRRDSGIKKIKDMIDDEEYLNIFVGEKESGTAFTWEGIVLQNKNYSKIKTSSLYGVEALRKVLENKRNIFLFVGALKSPMMQTIEKFGGDLRLVEINDESLESAIDPFGKSIYEIRKIPRSTYQTLQKGLFINTSISTLTVGAMFCVSEEWKQMVQSEGMELLTKALQEVNDELETPRY